MHWMLRATGTSVASLLYPAGTAMQNLLTSASTFSRFLLPSFLNLTVQSLWCSNTSTVIFITNIFILLHLWQALGSIATNIPVTNELLSAPSFTIQQLVCGLWWKLNVYNPCIGSTPNSNNSNNTNKNVRHCSDFKLRTQVNYLPNYTKIYYFRGSFPKLH